MSLGALGVIAAVTLRCVPAFRLRNVDQPEPLDDVLASLQERADAHDHFEFWTFPHAGVALTRIARPHRGRRRSGPGRPRAYTSDILLDNHAFRAVNEVARRFPSTIPRLNRFASAVASQRERVDWSYAIFASQRLVRFEEMEYALPREHAVDAVLARPRGARAPSRELPDRAALQRRRRRPALARSRPRQSTFVAVHVFRSMAFEPAFREVEAAMCELGGRPHWGKRSFLPRAELAPALPALGRLPARPPRARPRRPVRQRVDARRAGMSP